MEFVDYLLTGKVSPKDVLYLHHSLGRGYDIGPASAAMTRLPIAPKSSPLVRRLEQKDVREELVGAPLTVEPAQIDAHLQQVQVFTVDKAGNKWNLVENANKPLELYAVRLAFLHYSFNLSNHFL